MMHLTKKDVDVILGLLGKTKLQVAKEISKPYANFSRSVINDNTSVLLRFTYNISDELILKIQDLQHDFDKAQDHKK